MKNVLIYSRHGCHLCDIAEKTARDLQAEYPFQLSVKYIDDNPGLEKEYGEKVPVILIDNQPHDYWRLDKTRFISAISN